MWLIEPDDAMRLIKISIGMLVLVFTLVVVGIIHEAVHYARSKRDQTNTNESIQEECQAQR